jgi:hypothetical protein
LSRAVRLPSPNVSNEEKARLRVYLQKRHADGSRLKTGAD